MKRKKTLTTILKKTEKPIVPGTIRIKTKELKAYEKTESGWQLSKQEFPEAMLVILLFLGHNNFESLIDKKNPEFLKGQFSPDGKPQGARISTLPNGVKLDKAYSLFSRGLIIHSEDSNYHWNAMYKNPGGTYSYLYTIDKKKHQIKKKYQVVQDFEKYFRRLRKNLRQALHDHNDHLAVPMYTLLKTYMRIGNEIYFKAHGHKGLTTLKKKDIRIRENWVTFSYIGKDGVPIHIKRRFPDIYVQRLKKMLDTAKGNEYVFVIKDTNRPLQDTHFREAFKRYCGKEFYPHIVRSYYATARVKYFLKNHPTATKEEVKELFLDIAEKLGHKRFDKKKNIWREHATVTINHYVNPQLVEDVHKIVGKTVKRSQTQDYRPKTTDLIKTI